MRRTTASRAVGAILTAALVIAACASAPDEPDPTDAAPATSAVADPGSETVDPTTAPAEDSTTTSAAPVEADPVDGGETVDDPYYPTIGNTGYDVVNYELALNVMVEGNDVMDATATIDLTPLTDLSRFSFDLVGMTVDAVTVDGAEAAFEQTTEKLRIFPKSPLRTGTPATVTVDYFGNPDTLDSGTRIGPIGWYDAVRASVAVGEPMGARTWFPVNDHPTDKATYRFVLNVPTGFVGVANGELRETIELEDETITVWEMRQPMASYLATVAIGDFTLLDSDDGAGIDVFDAVATNELDGFAGDFDQTDEMHTRIEAFLNMLLNRALPPETTPEWRLDLDRKLAQKVTCEFQGAPLREVAEYVSGVCGVTIIVPEEVRRKFGGDVKFVDLPASQVVNIESLSGPAEDAFDLAVLHEVSAQPIPFAAKLRVGLRRRRVALHVLPHVRADQILAGGPGRSSGTPVAEIVIRGNRRVEEDAIRARLGL